MDSVTMNFLVTAVIHLILIAIYSPCIAYVTVTLLEKSGPYDKIHELREYLSSKDPYGDGFLAGIFRCGFCMSLWVSILIWAITTPFFPLSPILAPISVFSTSFIGSYLYSRL